VTASGPRPHPPSGQRPPAPVQRLLIRYAKRGRMRFASHRDIARAVERGVQRAGLPVAFSAGFSPHPKISYSGGAPTGAASEAEYLEISLTASLNPDQVRARLDRGLPEGIDVIEVADLAAGPAPRLEASVWQVVLPGVQPHDADAAVHSFLASQELTVERRTSSGTRRLNARAGVVALELDQRADPGAHAGCAILRMVVRHLTPAVRPDDILAALRHLSALEPASPPLVTRLDQGPLEQGLRGMSPGATEQGFRGSPPGPALGGDAAAGASAPGSDASATQGQEQATCLAAADATTACAAPESAYEQLPRGAERPAEAGCAREPDGRRPNARDRASGPRVR
jgi:radical SAM-linked protein